MPHIIMEYASELASEEQKKTMLDAVHKAVIDSGLFSVSNIKTRLLPVDCYRIADGEQTFIAVLCRIRPGRTLEQRSELSEAILMTIREQGWSADVITVEVVEMELDSYARYPAKS